jgi:hypothetical protein
MRPEEDLWAGAQMLCFELLDTWDTPKGFESIWRAAEVEVPSNGKTVIDGTETELSKLNPWADVLLVLFAERRDCCMSLRSLSTRFFLFSNSLKACPCNRCACPFPVFPLAAMSRLFAASAPTAPFAAASASICNSASALLREMYSS